MSSCPLPSVIIVSSSASRPPVPPLRRLRRRLGQAAQPLIVRFGLLRRTWPLRRDFGFSKGTPLDRHFIEGFLERHRADVHGVVLEAGGYKSYTRLFGGDRVTRAEVLYPMSGFPDCTIVGDLATGEGIPSETFDCLILTQVFPFIYDLPAAVRTCHRALKPGGVLLTTVPGISQICGEDRKLWGDYWRFTRQSLERLLGDAFGPENIEVEAHGNVFLACAFLHGLTVEEMTAAELATRDDLFQVTVMGRAVKAPRSASGADEGGSEGEPGR
jgi:SAM-dependent methyltransferase